MLSISRCALLIGFLFSQPLLSQDTVTGNYADYKDNPAGGQTYVGQANESGNGAFIDCPSTYSLVKLGNKYIEYFADAELSGCYYLFRKNASGNGYTYTKYNAQNQKVSTGEYK
jgi:hypothetical protein